MSSLSAINRLDVDDLVALVARQLRVDKPAVMPFADSTAAVTELFRLFDQPATRITCAGFLMPETAIAADRAEIGCDEVLGVSPFTGDAEGVISSVRDRDIIYVANPNRISGANFSIKDLHAMSEAVSNGLLIVDEYYYDHFGISALPLLKTAENIVVLRSFAAAFGIMSSDAGYAISSQAIISRLAEQLPAERISTTVRKTILASLSNEYAVNTRLQEIHEEQLRLALELNRLGIQCRITAGDFLLLRVADTKTVGNHLARFKIPIETLEGYPMLDHYLRYQIQSPVSNDDFLAAVRRLPDEAYRMKSLDLRAASLRRTNSSESDEAMPRLNRRESAHATRRQEIVETK